MVASYTPDTCFGCGERRPNVGHDHKCVDCLAGRRSEGVSGPDTEAQGVSRRAVALPVSRNTARTPAARRHMVHAVRRRHDC